MGTRHEALHEGSLAHAGGTKMTESPTLRQGRINATFELEEGDYTEDTVHTNGKTPQQSPTYVTHHPSTLTEVDEGEKCGWLGLTPTALQRFRTSKWILFWLCWAAVVQGMVINGFVNVCITTIEKRFNLRSTYTGLIAGSYDLGAVICSIPVSYFGSLPGASKPRWIGWGLLIMGLGSFAFSAPHFASPPYEAKRTHLFDSTISVMLCLKKGSDSQFCKSTSEEWLSSFQYVFLFAQFLHGVGASPLYTLGVAYIDESVPVKMSSFYLGIFSSMAVVGPALGYVIGGQLLDVYIDSPTVDLNTIGITKESDKWLGAWWIGFVISGVLAVSLSWFVMAFPPELPGAKQRALERTCAEGHADAKPFAHLRHMPGALMALLRNLPFVFLSLAEASEGLAVSGFATFMPKVLESQFSFLAGFASLLVGCIAVPAGGGGTFLGGWLVKRFQMDCPRIILFCVCVSAFNAVLATGFFLSCPDTPFAGVNVPYHAAQNRSSSLHAGNVTSLCNEDCNCEPAAFEPVCGANKILYYSPCYAGCTEAAHLETHKIFNNCACVKQNPKESSTEPLYLKSRSNFSLLLPEFSVSPQRCPSTCTLLAPFMVLFFTIMLTTFLISMPSMSATLRCVPDTHRSLALGIQGIQVRLLGTIPGPVIFGSVIDSTCSFWQPTCRGTGSCRQYSNAKLSRSLVALSVAFKLCSFTFYLLSSWAYGRNMKRMRAEDAQKNHAS